MVQRAERPPVDRVLLVRQVGGDVPVHPRHRLGQACRLEVREHVGLSSPASIARELTAQRQVAAVVEVILLQTERPTGEKGRLGIIARPQAHRHGGGRLQASDLGLDCQARLGREVQPAPRGVGGGHEPAKAYPRTAQPCRQLDHGGDLMPVGRYHDHIQGEGQPRHHAHTGSAHDLAVRASAAQAIMGYLTGAVETEGHAAEGRARFTQEGIELREGGAVADETVGVAGSAHGPHDLGELSVQGRLAPREGQVVDATGFPVPQHRLEERERQLAGAGMACVETVLTAQVAAVGQLDHQSGHSVTPSASRRRRANL